MRFNDLLMPITEAARSKPWVCGHSLNGIVGSNTAGGMEFRLLLSVVFSTMGLGDGMITSTEVSLL